MPYFPPPSLHAGMGVRPGIMYTLQSCAFLHLRHVAPETGQTVAPAILPYAGRCVNSLCDPGTMITMRGANPLLMGVPISRPAPCATRLCKRRHSLKKPSVLDKNL